MQEKEIQEKVEKFSKDGFLVIPDILSKTECDNLIQASEQNLKGRTFKNESVQVTHRMFEISNHFLELIFKEPILPLVESIIDDKKIKELAQQDHQVDFTGFNAATQFHAIHNSMIIVEPGKEGIQSWHQDDPPHYLVTNQNIPDNVHLPCLFLTVNYYLTDVLNSSNGPMNVIPKSHLFGKPCPKNIQENQFNVQQCLGNAGTAILFNNQLWHRGSHNSSNQTRYVAQTTYGRRIIGHMFHPFMNYSLPPHVLEQIKLDKKRKRIMGFLDHGPYG